MYVQFKVPRMYAIPTFCIPDQLSTIEHSNSQNNPFIHLVNKLLVSSFINLTKTVRFFFNLDFIWAHLISGVAQDRTLFCFIRTLKMFNDSLHVFP